MSRIIITELRDITKKISIKDNERKNRQKKESLFYLPGVV